MMTKGSKITYKRKHGIFSGQFQFDGVVHKVIDVDLAPGVKAKRYEICGAHGERAIAMGDELTEKRGA